jgi:putative transposase
VGVQLLVQQQGWQLERRRFFSEATMAKIPEPADALGLTGGDPSAQPELSTSRSAAATPSIYTEHLDR